MCVATAAFLSRPQKKAEHKEILEQLRDSVQRSWKAARTRHRLPTPPNLPGEGCLEVVKEMPSFSLIQQLLLSAMTNKQTLFQIHKSSLAGNSYPANIWKQYCKIKQSYHLQETLPRVQIIELLSLSGNALPLSAV